MPSRLISLLALGSLAACPKVTEYPDPSLEQKYPGFYDAWEQQRLERVGVPPQLAKRVYKEYMQGEDVARDRELGVQYTITASDLVHFHYTTRGTNTREAMNALDDCVDEITSINNGVGKPVYNKMGAAKLCMNGRTHEDAQRYAALYEGMWVEQSFGPPPGLLASYFTLRFAENLVDPEKAKILSDLIADKRGGRYYEDQYAVLTYASSIPMDALNVLTKGRPIKNFPLSLQDIAFVSNNQKDPDFVRYVAELIDLGLCRDEGGDLEVGYAITLWQNRVKMDDIHQALDVGVQVCYHVPATAMHLVNQQSIHPRLIQLLIENGIEIERDGVYLHRLLPNFAGPEGVTKMERTLREFERKGILPQQGLSELFEPHQQKSKQTARNRQPLQRSAVRPAAEFGVCPTYEYMRDIEDIATLEATVTNFDESPDIASFTPTFEYRIGVPPDNPIVVMHYKALERIPDAIQRLVFVQQGGKVVFITGPVIAQPENAHLKGKRVRDLGILFDELAGYYNAAVKTAFFRVDVRDPELAPHEFGHMVDHLVGKAIYGERISDRTLWKSIAQQCSLYTPDDNGSQEFADGFAKYYESRDSLETTCPQAANYFTLLEQMVALYLQEH